MKRNPLQLRFIPARRARLARPEVGLRAAGAGFTLIELLVVMFVLAILVALVVGVGRWVRVIGQEKQTIVTQKIVMAAIQAYYDTYEVYPADGGNGDESDDSGKELLKNLKGEGFGDEEKARVSRATMKVLRGLPQGALSAGGEDVKDGFGNGMRYDKDSGLGGRPVVISAGPDGKFDVQADNIRSDQQ